MEPARKAAKPFDAMLAWADARGMVSANREVLAAIAGVFYLLPGLIGAVALPRLDVNDKMSEPQMQQAILGFYDKAGPLLVLLSLPIAVGFMTMFAIMLDPARPTVGAAIGQSLKRLPSYLAASIMTGFLLMAAWVLFSLVAMALLPLVLAVPLALLLMSWPLLRLMFVTPEIAAGNVLNPFRAIGRSLARTRRATLSLLGYFGPAVAVFFVMTSLLMLVIGVLLAQWGQGETQQLVAEAVFYVLFAGGYTFLAALIASAWKQLAPPPAA